MAGRSDVFEWLVQELQLEVNEQNNDGKTALHCAAYHNKMECARLLLCQNALLFKDQDGDTPLDRTKTEGRYIVRQDIKIY